MAKLGKNYTTDQTWMAVYSVTPHRTLQRGFKFLESIFLKPPSSHTKHLRAKSNITFYLMDMVYNLIMIRIKKREIKSVDFPCQLEDDRVLEILLCYTNKLSIFSWYKSLLQLKKQLKHIPIQMKRFQWWPKHSLFGSGKTLLFIFLKSRLDLMNSHTIIHSVVFFSFL